MTTIRERIAMEIFDKIIARIDDGREPEDICFEAADAVLAELESPSEEMMDAMHSVLFDTTCPAGHEMQRFAFTAAIRAAKQG